MKKKFKLSVLSLTLGACTGAMAASTIVPGLTLSGVVDSGYVSTTNTGTTTSKTTAGAASSILGVSNVGIKGDKDFGDGLNGFFNFQIGFNPTTGKLSDTSTLFSRNAYIGVKGDFGSASVGKQWNLNDDWLVGSVFKGGYNAGAVFKFSEFDAVSDIYSNSIKYVTPEVAGLQGAAMVASKINGTEGSLTNVGVKYVTGPLYVAATTFTEKSTTDTQYKLNTLGASYALGAFKPRLGYSSADVAAGSYASLGTAVAAKANVLDVGLDYAVSPKTTLSLDSLKHKNTTASNNASVTRFLVTYAWRPDVSLVANVAKITNSSTSAQSLSSDGVIAGKSQQSVALGVRLAF